MVAVDGRQEQMGVLGAPFSWFPTGSQSILLGDPSLNLMPEQTLVPEP